MAPSLPPVNLLSGQYVDRVAQLRRDHARLAALLDDPNTLIIPVWRAQSLVEVREEGLGAYFVSRQRLHAANPTDFIWLGVFRERACFAIDIESAEAPAFESRVEARDLRAILGELPVDEAGVLAYARALLIWRERHRFCGRCGARTLPEEGGHVLRCSDDQCQLTHFPRIDPAIIVLVTDGERALLGRQPSWPEGRYSTIAGFVEPGESLEDAVAREVQEETGVRVQAVQYHSSQPWPFPSSLMVGFIAEAASTQILLGDDELQDARWFTRSEIAQGAIALPTPHSISFGLIEHWYDRPCGRPLREEPDIRMWRSSPRPSR